MSTFVYEAKDSRGLLVRGLVTAETRAAAFLQLKNFPIQIRSLHETSKSPSLFNRLMGVRQAALAIFTRELAAMFRAGIPLLRCLELLSVQRENRRLEDVTLLAREEIKSGSSFFAALSHFPDVFNPVYLALVQSGELSGSLGEILDRLSLFLEKDSKMRQKAKAAMAYPLIVFLFCVLISAGLVMFIFPQFINLFEGLQVRMPWPTEVLIFIVNALRNPFVILLLFLLAGGIFAALSQYMRTSAGRRQYHQWLLTLPILGPIHRKIAISRFCRTFATLFANGVPILHALDVVSTVSGNELVNDAILGVREAVKYGSSISAPLEESSLFPLMVTSMIQVGEQSGHLQTMLTKVADYYDMEVEIALSSLAKLLEPVLIGIMGLIVGFVLVAIFLPIYELIGSFSR